MGYSWTPQEALDLLASDNAIKIIGSNQKLNVQMECPVCHNRRAFYNTRNGVWCCNTASCGVKGDSATLASLSWGISLREARFLIEDKLGIRRPEYDSVRPQRTVRKPTPIPEEVKRAPVEIMDATYRAFMNQLTLSQKNRDNLLSRGFTPEKIEEVGYRTFPSRAEVDYEGLCKRLIKDGYTLKGVPGFYTDKLGQWTFPSFTKGIIMPRVNHNGLWTGLQIRKDDDLRICHTNEDGSVELESKCVWFASGSYENGCKAFGAIHYSCDFSFDPMARKYIPILNAKGPKGIVLTEGIMKGDLTEQIQSNVPVCSVQGVAMLSDLKDELMYLKNTLGLEVVALAFDMDYLTNENVQASLEKAKKIITECGLRIKQYSWATDVTIDGKTFYLKGIDDYLAFHKLGIKPEVK